ncbi:MAG: hypothetical protein KC653_02360, partial [Candidatus Andersenbacteria bacterium]|nr:hypothetical protein [Candidatus Andersenbacteria bacterium]
GSSALLKLLLSNPYILGIIGVVLLFSLLVSLVLFPAFSAPVATCTVGNNLNIPETVTSHCATLVTEGAAGGLPVSP